MTPGGAALAGGAGLLERAVTYCLGAVAPATPELLSRPTPCGDWDLRALLTHLHDSLSALAEAAEGGRIAGEPVPGPAGGDPVRAVRAAARRVLGAWAADARESVSVGGLSLTGVLLTATGAVEVAVHGWDVARACGRDDPIPEPLAEELLELVSLVLDDADRPGRFGAPLAVRGGADAGERLLAFLGRRVRCGREYEEDVA
ncbi:TIGR03086 family metal-binding protein [Amycolatopsis cynarae]|uniref:TIGR03086 family metal-binding protein n=1 Tax=Amycolatopsis cynarae TaxID=2995223 RepID=A0ABY7B6Q3_9PSEU|nr:TIGR03086 family metal-binding protein [Amycolatopsis sp. HUAS 11-8]WAL66868.1 TIGR03086 family metal-binding protein [Amycolatopsis sp. HUAS 11-8]